MTDNTQPLALMLADRLHHEQPTVLRIDAEHAGEELRRQHARIAELEAQLSSSGFTAADMATAEARGFRDGVASVAANAGSEPVANDRPSLEDVFRGLSDRAYCSYIEQMRRNECLGWEHKVKHGTFGEAELKAHTLAGRLLGRHHAFAEAANALRGSNAPLTHPSPPEGMVGGWTKASQQLPPCRDDQLYVGINTVGFAGVFNAVIDIAGNVHCMYVTPEEAIDVMGSLDIWQPLTPPTTSAGSEKGE